MGLLDGKVCIVTGAGRGIGRDHALALANRGARVVVNDPGVAVDGQGSDNAPAEQVVAEIKASGGEAIANFANVADWQQAQALVQQAWDTWGTLDVLINNAGILRDRIIWTMTEQDWDAVMGVHMKGTYNCTHHAVVRWRARFKQDNQPVNARIINTVSGAMFGSVGQSNYGAAKAGIMGFTLGVALEVAQMGITCNAIRPGGQTRMSQSIPSTGALAAVASRTQAESPQKEDKDAAKTQGSELAAYLASDAASWISGQLLMIRDDRLELDKGWRAERVLTNRGGKPWTAEDLMVGMPKLVGTGPTGLIEFLGY